ncbi:histone H2A-like [Trachemys scripta elegans]|uniref:histone H2A-like n=1 Tax=Trachemys scripta elegans TaxID=31138 RepID=UPI001554EC5D|nr:histone H2A-like [Trachemys scripta elegans]
MSGPGKTREAPQANSKSQSSREKLQFPVDHIEKMLRQGHCIKRIKGGALVYLAAVMEYLTTELLALAGNATRDDPRRCITPRHLRLAIRRNKDLHKLLLGGGAVFQGGILPNSQAMLLKVKSNKSSRNKSLRLPGDNTLQEK